MKINESAAVKPNSTFQKTCEEKAGGFEQWLNHDDGYYWYHQDQLENSALQFKPLDQEKKPAGSNLDCIEKSSAPPNSTERKTEQKLAAQSSAEELKATPFIKANRLEEPLAQDFTDFKQQLENPRTAENSFIQQAKPKALPTNNQTANKTLFSPIVFKEHQLFIKDREAEFSLNTSKLSQQQTKELSQALKQWLKNKGITLQTLMINGVKQ